MSSWHETLTAADKYIRFRVKGVWSAGVKFVGDDGAAGEPGTPGADGADGTEQVARVQSVGTSTISVKLLNAAGAETGDAFNVTPVTKLGVAALSAQWPGGVLVAGKDITVFQDAAGDWRTTVQFDDQTE